MLRARLAALLAFLLIPAVSSYALTIYEINESSAQTLGSLASGGSLTFGNYVFSGFSYTNSAENDAAAPGAGIQVTAVTVKTDVGDLFGLRFNAGWTAGPDQIADTTIRYSVHPAPPAAPAAPEYDGRQNSQVPHPSAYSRFGSDNRQGPKGPFVEFWPGKAQPKKFLSSAPSPDQPPLTNAPHDIDALTACLQLMTAYGARGTGQAAITTNVYARNPDGSIIATPLLDMYTFKNASYTYNHENLELNPAQDGLYIVTDVAVRGGAAFNGSASISEFYTLFAYDMIPEPASLTLLGLGFIALSKRRRRP